VASRGRTGVFILLAGFGEGSIVINGDSGKKEAEMGVTTDQCRQAPSENLDFDLSEIIKVVKAADLSDDEAFHDMLQALFEGEPGESLMDRLGLARPAKVSNGTLNRWIAGHGAPAWIEDKEEVREAILDVLQQAERSLDAAGY